MECKRIRGKIREVQSHASGQLQLILLTISRHTEQFMGNENKTGLNELAGRSSITSADHYLHSSTTLDKYDCRSFFAWKQYFPLNSTELQLV